MILICKFEHDEDCCNSGSPQYMCKCKPDVCNSAVPMTNADRIRAMSDEELSDFLCGMIVDCETQNCPAKEICRFHDNGMRKWVKQPAKEA